MTRILQRLAIRPGTPYVFSFDARGGANGPAIDAEICARLLLYPQDCIALPFKFEQSGTQWRHYQFLFDSHSLGAGIWLMRAPVQLEMSVFDGKSADVDNVSLIDRQTGAELIRNGNFSNANEGWFFSSDRHHLPWHIKNFPLNIFFELGWFGALAFGLLLASVMARLMAQISQGSAMAPIYLASLSGFFAVGLFDSLLDVPRLGLLFFLLLAIASLQPVSRHIGKRRRRRRALSVTAANPAVIEPAPVNG